MLDSDGDLIPLTSSVLTPSSNEVLLDKKDNIEGISVTYSSDTPCTTIEKYSFKVDVMCDTFFTGQGTASITDASGTDTCQTTV